MALVRDGGLDPFNGALYVFRSKWADRIRIVWWNGNGVCLYSNDRRSYYTWSNRGATVSGFWAGEGGCPR
ncbi:hypothetical protein CO676_34270 [Sinorhizobium sp. BJ1]|nr:hypothetical protein CO676_34270 [Sinorhizobium sp. BJ1]